MNPNDPAALAPNLAARPHEHILRVRNFTHLTQAELLLILERRNHPDVRHWMVHTEPITVEEHLSYCAALAHRPEVLALFAEYDGHPCCVDTYRAADCSWHHIVDSGSYACAPAPCSTAVAIKLILLKVLSTYPVQSYQVKIKNDNEMALFVNQYYFGFVVTGRDDNYTYMQAQLNKTPSDYEAQMQAILARNRIHLELQF